MSGEGRERRRGRRRPRIGHREQLGAGTHCDEAPPDRRACSRAASGHWVAVSAGVDAQEEPLDHGCAIDQSGATPRARAVVQMNGSVDVTHNGAVDFGDAPHIIQLDHAIPAAPDLLLVINQLYILEDCARHELHFERPPSARRARAAHVTWAASRQATVQSSLALTVAAQPGRHNSWQ